MLDLFGPRDYLESAVWISALVFIRVSAAMALLPAFGEQVTPMRVKLIISLSLSIIVLPIVWDELARNYARSSWLSLVLTEVAAGLLIGFLFRIFVIVLQLAGTVAAQSTSLSQIFGGGLGSEPQPAMSTLLVVAGLCFATFFGFHIQVTEALALSYRVFPPGVGISADSLSQWGITQIGEAFSLGISIAGPFILASLLYNLALGAISRAMPQLMVAFVGAPAISLGGLVILFLTAPLTISVWADVFFKATDLRQGTF